MSNRILVSVLSLALTMTGCSTQKENTEKEMNGKIQLVGAYTNHRPVSAEEKKMFEKTYSGGVKLTPVKVATQVVAGTNYSFVCNDSKSNIYEVIIYEPLPGQGAPEVTSVTKK